MEPARALVEAPPSSPADSDRLLMLKRCAEAKSACTSNLWLAGPPTLPANATVLEDSRSISRKTWLPLASDSDASSMEGLAILALTASIEEVSPARFVTIAESSEDEAPPQPPLRQSDTGTTP